MSESHSHSLLISYALFPGMKQSSPVDWQLLVIDEVAEVTENNVRIHELVKGQDLADVLEGFKHCCTKAVVFVNTENNYKLAGEFVSNVPEFPFPLLIVKREDGEEILSYRKCHNGERVLARIDAENEVDKEEQEPSFSVSGQLSFLVTCLIVLSLELDFLTLVNHGVLLYIAVP